MASSLKFVHFMVPNAAGVGDAVSMQFAASGGTAPYTWGAAASPAAPLGLEDEFTLGVPAGLTMSTVTAGLLAGAPTTVGKYLFRLTVTDADGDAYFEDFIFNVAADDDSLTLVTVAPGRELVRDINGFNFTYTAGDQVSIPTFEVQYLVEVGIILS